MSLFTSIDLSQLPPPTVVEPLDYESILAAMLSDLQTRDSTFSALLESDPAYKILEVAAYRELLLRHRINDAASAVMLAYAVGSDLDQIAAGYGVARLTIRAAEPDAVPPVEAEIESDAELRRRVLLSLEGYTTAGSRGSYIYHALSASADCKDIGVTSLEPGTVNVAILSRTGMGYAPPATIAAVVNALNAEQVRPLCDTVKVESAQVMVYDIVAGLTLYPDADQDSVLARAQAAIETYVQQQHQLGRDVNRSAIFAALHQVGVQNVTLSSPAADIPVLWNQAPWCQSLRLSVSGTDL